MKRTLIVGTFHILAAAFTLLLAASIFYSCRTGRTPHRTPHTQSSASRPSAPTHEVHHTGRRQHTRERATASTAVLKFSLRSEHRL